MARSKHETSEDRERARPSARALDRRRHKHARRSVKRCNAAEEQAGELYGRASERLGEWRERGVHQIEVVRGQVRQHALTSALIAFAAGFILSRLLFRRT